MGFEFPSECLGVGLRVAVGIEAGGPAPEACTRAVVVTGHLGGGLGSWLGWDEGAR